MTCALENNQAGCVQILLEQEIWDDVLYFNESGLRNLLFIAVNLNSPECLDVLIKCIKKKYPYWSRHAHLEPTDDIFGYSPVFWATIKGRVKCLDILLSAGARMHYHDDAWGNDMCYNTCDCAIQMPLHVAAAFNLVETLKVLLKHCNEYMIDNTNKYKATAFWYAASYRHMECMEILLEAGATPTKSVKVERYRLKDKLLLDVPYTGIAAVLHHKHTCNDCKFTEMKKSISGDFEVMEPAWPDYNASQPGNDNKKCVYCKTALCDCDGLEDCIEIFSVDKMRKYIGQIPKLDIDAIVTQLNHGFAECIHMVRPDLLQIMLQHGVDLHQHVDTLYGRFRSHHSWGAQADPRMPIPSVLDQLVEKDAQYEALLPDESIVASAVSFLHWKAVWDQSSSEKVKELALECLRVIVDYDNSFDKMAVKDQFCRRGIGERILFLLAGSSWFEGFKYLVEGGINVNTGLEFGRNTPLMDAIRFHFKPVEKLKLLLSHGAAARLPNFEHYPRFSLRNGPAQTIEVASLLKAAGIRKSSIYFLSLNMKMTGEWLARRKTWNDEQKARFDRFFEELDSGSPCISLLDCCRDVLGKHLMASNPNSNLFRLVPKLPLPQVVKDFLLYNMDLNLTTEQNDD